MSTTVHRGICFVYESAFNCSSSISNENVKMIRPLKVESECILVESECIPVESECTLVESECTVLYIMYLHLCCSGEYARTALCSVIYANCFCPVRIL